MALKTEFPFKKNLVNYVWKSVQLTDSLLKDAPVVDLSKSYTVEQACAHLSEDLSFVEKLMVANVSIAEFKNFSIHEYFNNCGLFHDSLIDDVASRLEHLPDDFINWTIKKSLGPKDFRVFIYENLIEFKKTFSHLSAINPSKMNGLKALELLFDLYSLSDFSESAFLEITSEKTLLKTLHKKRFPLSFKSDESLEKRFSQISLPKDIKLSVRREGDQNKMIVTLKSSHPKDLNSKLLKFTKNFSSIEKAWSEGEA